VCRPNSIDERQIGLAPVTGTLPESGEVGYCAANEFLDAFSYYRTLSTGQFTVTINWDGWQEVGMLVRAIQQQAQMRHNPDAHQAELVNALSSSEGAAVFERVLASRFPRVVVSTVDLARMVIERTGSNLLRSRETSQETHRRPDLSSRYVAPRNAYEQTIADIWQDLLGIEQIGVHDNFLELGGHSLLATQVASRLRDVLHVELPLRHLLEATTVAELAEWLETILWAAGEQHSEANSAEDHEEIEL
jgi:acyl carrier protein